MLTGLRTETVDNLQEEMMFLYFDERLINVEQIKYILVKVNEDDTRKYHAKIEIEMIDGQIFVEYIQEKSYLSRVYDIRARIGYEAGGSDRTGINL